MILEEYANTLYLGNIAQRWSVHPLVIIGGSIADQADYEHLANDFGVRSVLNVETEHSDEGKGIGLLAECRVPDDGSTFSPDLVRHAVSFAKMMIGHGPIYVHCQQGGSRSPAFAYAILRWVFQMTAEDAMKAIRMGKDTWSGPAPTKPNSATTYGIHPFHQSYLASVESALKLP